MWHSESPASCSLAYTIKFTILCNYKLTCAGNIAIWASDIFPVTFPKLHVQFQGGMVKTHDGVVFQSIQKKK